MNPCPTPSQLATLLEETSDEALEAHIEECDDCRRSLLDLAGAIDSAWLRLLRERDDAPRPRAAFLERLKSEFHEGPRIEGSRESPPCIDGLEIIEKIGRGGTGAVYRARRLGTNEMVAVKVIHPSLVLRAEDWARVRRGAEAVYRLRHPQIIELLEVGESNGTWYGILEYAEGGSLEEKLRTEGPLPPRAAAELVLSLARTIRFIHERNYIHRDLKTSNILIASDGTPKIADFGLARVLSGGKDVTAPGEIMGTPSFMAPEQALGRSAEVGPATDLYGLGAILYELLTGQPPFQGTTRLNTLQQVVHMPPVPPSQMRAGVPPDLERICLKCLEKRPDQRYPDARRLAEALEAHLAGKASGIDPSAPGTMRWRRALRWILIVMLAWLAGLSTAWIYNWASRRGAKS